MKLTEEERYMKEAIRQARKAGKLNEVPIGCVIVRYGKIIARDTIEGIQISIRWPMRNCRL